MRKPKVPGELQWIVLAWVVSDFIVTKLGQSDIGIPAKLAPVRVAKAAVWKSRGSIEDVYKARAHAAQQTDEHVSVYCYPVTEKNPLDRAKKDALRDDASKLTE
jgi:hypothetical protein